MPKIIESKVLYAATNAIFAANGYDGTKMKDIAKRADANEATLFRRFGSKAGLIAAALNDLLADVPLAQLQPSDDLRADLVAITRAYIDTFQLEGMAVMTLMVELSRHPELQKATDALRPNIMRMVGIIAHHQKAGRIGDTSAFLLLSELIGPIALVGLNIRSGLAPINDLGLFDVEGFVDRFLRGHATAPNS